MKFEEFLMELHNYGRGVVAFNTYNHDCTFCFYLMIAGTGKRGLYHKIEGEVSRMDDLLDSFILLIKTDANNNIVGGFDYTKGQYDGD